MSAFPCGRLWSTAIAMVCLTLAWTTAGVSAASSETGRNATVNADFTEGSDAPVGWSLSGGKGRWVDRQILEVTGAGDDSNFWRADCEFTPGGLYRFETTARQLGGSGCVVAGPAFASRDRHLSDQFKSYAHVFRVPDDVEKSYLRLGQWHATGTVQFDAVRLVPVLPVHARTGDLLLGSGEAIRNGRYAFAAQYHGDGSNYHRTLHEATARFNSDRWCFGASSRVTYRFSLPPYRFEDGRVAFHVNYYTRGACVAEISRDGLAWQPLATQGDLGAAEATLPAELLPAEVLYVRLRGEGDGASFQVNRVEFEGQLSGSPADAQGETLFAEVESNDELVVEQMTLARSSGADVANLQMTLKNAATQDVVVAVCPTLRATGAAEPTVVAPQDLTIPAGKTAIAQIEMPEAAPGDHVLDVALRRADGTLAHASLPLAVPDYYRSDYGARIAGIEGDNVVWWCDATRKIPRQRPAPAVANNTPTAEMSAARHDYEAVQVVIRPSDKALTGLTATAGDFVGPDGAVIPAKNIQLLRVFYHYVHHATDRTGLVDYWPDALPPLDEPLDVAAGQNQPLWVLVYVPKDAAAGDYLGNVTLKADGFTAQVPIKLHVWNFALPETNHLETAFGLRSGTILSYHGVKTEEDRRRVLDSYMETMSQHRISPYDPVPLDPIRVKFLAEADPPRAEVDFSAFDPAFTRAIERYHFTNFRLPIQGMGGGTFHARYEPKIGAFTEDTPEYQAMFSSYMKQLEDHFRAKGWLSMPYVYWFDEPDPKDYEFVANGFERLKKYAPAIPRMLTEEPSEQFQPPVDIWCPVSHNYDHEEAEKQRAHGARFWWYVCCGPKAPYCTLFVDHPAVELRTWLWQTWQRNIVGILVWESTYWTSSAAYPDPKHPQNPYEDPMAYVSGYSTPKGVKRYWGNGDGRFIYPPLAAAVPGATGNEPVFDAPVSSIRLEMLREGIEDYETLYLLRALLAKHRAKLSASEAVRYERLLEVPPSITTDMTTFSTDPTAIYTHRREVAEAIEQLRR